MAHELVIDSSGKASIALRGGSKTAWHGLGQEILPGDSLAAIARKAGLDWQVLQAPVSYTDDKGHEHQIGNTMVNYRSDTKADLGVVSANKYNIVQPSEVLEFFRDFLADNKLMMETAGAVRGGQIIWAMAKLGPDFSFLMPGKDRIDTYVRLQTGFTGKVGTDLTGTTIRQVCANTMALVDRDAARDGYKVSHSAIFDAKALQAAFGLLGEQYKVTAQVWNAMVARKVTADERRQFICDLFGEVLADMDKTEGGKPVISTRRRNQMEAIEAAFANGPGAGLKSAKDTAFGLLQAVTHWVDHQASAIDRYSAGESNARLTAAWFGLGEKTKQDAQILCAELAGVSELVAA